MKRKSYLLKFVILQMYNNKDKLLIDKPEVINASHYVDKVRSKSIFM